MRAKRVSRSYGKRIRTLLTPVAVIAEVALEAKFDDFFVGSISRKSTYPLGHRRFARNSNPTKKARIWPQMEFCNYLGKSSSLFLAITKPDERRAYASYGKNGKKAKKMKKNFLPEVVHSRDKISVMSNSMPMTEIFSKNKLRIEY